MKLPIVIISYKEGEKMVSIDIGKIRLERANQGLSISELAKITGINKYTISRLENNKTMPRLDTIGKIAKALGKTIEDFKKI